MSDQEKSSGADAAVVAGAGSIDTPERQAACHTPGPWRVVAETDGYADVIDVVADQYRHLVCYTPKAENPNYGPNAHLIAAAPELLEALKHVMGWIDAWSPTFTDDAAWPEYEHNIKAAIAKAEAQS